MTTMSVLDSLGATKNIQMPGVQPDGGLLIFKRTDLDEAEQDVKTSAGQLYGGWVYNNATALRYLKFYNNTAAGVVVGTTVPTITLPLPASSLVILGGPGLAHGIEFGTGICVAVTTGLADNNAGAPSADDVTVALFYK